MTMQTNPLQLVQLAWISGSCALFGVLVGAFISGLFTLRAKRNEYVNDFYKIVIDKRVEAYEHLELLIQSFKTCVVDSKVDNLPYHCPFATESQNFEALVRMGNTMNRGLWLSDRAFNSVRELNLLQFSTPSDEIERIRFGKERYQKIAMIRERLEKDLAADMLQLHKVKKFLRSKRRNQGFGFVDLQRGLGVKPPMYKSDGGMIPPTSIQKD
jgi:hypothetical protein